MFLHNLVLKFLHPYTYSSEAYIEYLQKKGAKIGHNCKFYDPQSTHVDVSRAFLLSIGDNTSITRGVVILDHDYSYSVLNEVYKVMSNPCRETKIGRNCFIGMNSIILSGADIGDNCIIGSGSVVSGKIESNTVVGGVPAKKICTLEQFKDKQVSDYDKSAKLYARKYYETYKRWPSISEMGVYISLFLPRTEENFHYFLELNSRMANVGNNLFDIKPVYSSYDEFISLL